MQGRGVRQDHPSVGAEHDRAGVVGAQPGELVSVDRAALAGRYREQVSEVMLGATEARYAANMARSLSQLLHNPCGRECGCDPDCWCRRTALARPASLMVVSWTLLRAPSQESGLSGLETGARPDAAVGFRNRIGFQ